MSSFISLRDGALIHGPFGENELYHLALSLASCLDKLHSKGEQHGFLSPDFVAVSIDGTIKLGTAGPDVATSTLPEYIAPEVLTGSRVSPLSDVYQLGLLLHELAVCSAPFAIGDREMKASSIYKVKPFQRPAPVSKRFAEIIQKCYEKDPSKRFSDGGELLAVLNRLPEEVEVISNYKVEDADFSDWFSHGSGTSGLKSDIRLVDKRETEIKTKKVGLLNRSILTGATVVAIVCAIAFGISFWGSTVPAVKAVNDLQVVFTGSGAILKWRSPEEFSEFNWNLYIGGKLVKSGVAKGSSFSSYSVTFDKLIVGGSYRLSLSQGQSEVGQVAFTCQGEVK